MPVMSPSIAGLVLLAALLHAPWNALAKSSGEPHFSIASFPLVSTMQAELKGRAPCGKNFLGHPYYQLLKTNGFELRSLEGRTDGAKHSRMNENL